MKMVDYVLVQPRLGEWSEETNARIRDQSRSLGYFIGKFLREKRITSHEFSGIFFEGHNDISDKATNESSKLLTVPVLLIESEFQSKKSLEEVNEYLISSVEAGLSKLEKKYTDIVSSINESITIFRGIGYVCKWTHKTKKIREKRIEVSLECAMDISEFTLSLIVRSKEKLLFSEAILSTPPNEYCFKHKFRDIVIEGEECQITDFLNTKWATLNMGQPYQVILHEM